jgi:hypothetical protein
VMIITDYAGSYQIWDPSLETTEFVILNLFRNAPELIPLIEHKVIKCTQCKVQSYGNRQQLLSPSRGSHLSLQIIDISVESLDQCIALMILSKHRTLFSSNAYTTPVLIPRHPQVNAAPQQKIIQKRKKISEVVLNVTKFIDLTCEVLSFD